jgi:isopenicillin N synthase-like dioxygenase
MGFQPILHQSSVPLSFGILLLLLNEAVSFSTPFQFTPLRQKRLTGVIAMAKESSEDVSPAEVAPLISLSSKVWNSPIGESNSNSEQLQQVGQEVVKALQTSGFLRIQSDLMPQELQQAALNDATEWLTTTSPAEDPLVVRHPTDPKTYVMLETKDVEEKEEKGGSINFTPTLVKYWNACEQLKKCVLRAIGVGLNLAHPEDLATWHDQGSHSAMRLLHYPPANASTGNRCKAHSDYGTVTLLSTDGVSGLEIFLKGKWWPVPHIPGAMVVNIGSLLSDWTKRSDGEPLLATVHRVAGPASENSASDPNVLKMAMSQGRTSIAFFADPDDDTPLSSDNGMTMDEYVQWRSGGNSKGRSGVAFTEAERKSLIDPQALSASPLKP